MRRLIRPKTISGKIRLFSLIFYLSSSTLVLAQNKPSTAVSRALQTRSFPTDVKTTLKASINALQDLDYTIDVLNSDVGLITASRTTEEKKAEVSTVETVATETNSNNEEAVKAEQTQTCVKVLGIAFVAVFAVILLGAIFGDDDDDDESSSSSSSSGWKRNRGSSNTTHKTVNNYS